jgi:GxxExxY protein
MDKIITGTDKVEFYKVELTEKIIGCAYRVYNTLGSGFFEKVYENSLLKDLTDEGLATQQQVPMKVIYRDSVVGDYVADLIVEGCVVVEVKAVERIIKIHEVQLVNYLKATGIRLGLLINFGPTIEIKRRIYGWTQGNTDLHG